MGLEKMGATQNSGIEENVGETAARRPRSKQKRREIAEESLQPGASAAVVARRYGVNANQVFHWRKLLRQGQLEAKAGSSQLMPVRIAEVIEDKPVPGPIHQPDGTIHIELGRVRVRLQGSVDTAVLRAILEILGR